MPTPVYNGEYSVPGPDSGLAISYDPIQGRQRFEFSRSYNSGVSTTLGYNGSVPIYTNEWVTGMPRPLTVFGADDRQPVSNVTAFPWRANCKLYMTFPNGKMFVGSGALIGNKYVVSCGHCIYSHDNGGWATRVEVVPGLYQSSRPYGSAFAVNYRTYNGWVNSRDRFYDISLITLDRNIGSSTGWFGYAYQPNLNNWTVHFGGYDADRYNGLVQLYRYGPVTSDATTGFYYNIDMKGGSSGSGVYYVDGSSNRYVVGVNGWESASWNFATKITSQRFNDIKSWIASGR